MRSSYALWHSASELAVSPLLLQPCLAGARGVRDSSFPLVSAKIGRLKPGQLASATPYSRVSKCVAALLVRRLVCEYVTRKLIRDLEVPAPARTGYALPALVEVPEILPPRGPEGLLLTYPLPDQRTQGFDFSLGIWHKPVVSKEL